jgi:hypothetical protein
MEFKPIRKAGKPSLPGYSRLEGDAPAYVTGYKEAGKRLVPIVSTRLSGKDRLGGLAVRWNLPTGRGARSRDDYKVAPGLYAVGDPASSSPVLVSANYKLSFDSLRSELGGIDAWILVLDTKGVNVWCAAGKGSFGSAELLDKIARLRLADIVAHRTLVLPQLGAPGVSAPEIARVSGFRVAWGPVRAADIRAFLAAGMKKTDAMRRVEFRLADRMAVAPVELAQAWPFLLAALALSLLGALPLGPGFGPRLGWLAAATLGSVLVGTLAFPALLPYLPTKAFSIKGAVLGALWGILCAAGAAYAGPGGGGMGAGLGAAVVLVSAPVASFIGLNFTGSTTFTCQSGANLEVEKSIVPTIASLALGLCLGGAARVFGF